jgi:hypothetical protein
VAVVTSGGTEDRTEKRRGVGDEAEKWAHDEQDVRAWLLTCIGRFGLNTDDPMGAGSRLLRQLSVLHDRGDLATDSELAEWRRRAEQAEADLAEARAVIEEWGSYGGNLTEMAAALDVERAKVAKVEALARRWQSAGQNPHD